MEIRTEHCLRFLEQVRNVDGDIVECGVGSGATLLPIARWALNEGRDRRVFAADTFEGLPYTDEATPVESDLQVGECAEISAEDFQKLLIQRKLAGVVEPVVGLFEDVLEEGLKGAKIAFAFLDADCYRSTLAAYRIVFPKLSPGAILGFHDYGFVRTPGVTHVVDNEVDMNLFKVMLCGDDCLFLRRKRAPETRPAKPTETSGP